MRYWHVQVMAKDLLDDDRARLDEVTPLEFLKRRARATIEVGLPGWIRMEHELIPAEEAESHPRYCYIREYAGGDPTYDLEPWTYMLTMASDDPSEPPRIWAEPGYVSDHFPFVPLRLDWPTEVTER